MEFSVGVGNSDFAEIRSKKTIMLTRRSRFTNLWGNLRTM